MASETLGVRVERFLNTKHNAQTRTWYAKYLNPLVDFLGADREVESITPHDAERYWQAVQARRTCWETHPVRPTQVRPLSPTTLQHYLRAARTLWNALMRQHLVRDNPFDHLRAPKDTRSVAMKAISAQDERAILQVAAESSRRDYAIVTVMATSGVRAGELISMSLHTLDLRRGEALVNGKRGWRKAWLGVASVEALRAYIDEERPHGREDTLWLSRFGEPLTLYGVRQLIDRLAERAGVVGRHNLHAFRHRTAQAWLDQGMNAETVAQLLGHADVALTLRIYGNQDERRVRQAMRKLEMAPFEEPDDEPDQLRGGALRA